MATACLEAFRELGLPVLSDLNGEREITGNGFAYMNQIIENGRRHSMARAFLYPVLAQDNVTVLVNTQVNRVLLKGTAPWAWSACGTARPTFRAHREVILSAGGFNTPKLLMLSGIGDESELRSSASPYRCTRPRSARTCRTTSCTAAACTRRPSRSCTTTAPLTCRATEN